MFARMSEASLNPARIDAFAGATVLILGDVMLDRYVHGRVDRMSPEAPIPVLAIEWESAMAGGAGNVARNVAALGARAILIGLIGTDEAGRELGRLLKVTPRVDARLVQDTTRPTTAKTRFVAGRQQLLRADAEQAAVPSADGIAALLAEFRRALPEADVVVLSDYAKGVLGDQLVAEAIAAARQAGKPIVTDPKSRDFARYRGSSIITPNRAEFAAASGVPGRDAGAIADGARRLIAAAGIDAILVTRGEDGMTLVDGDEDAAALDLGAEAREVFDVSGAGDTVVAVLAVARAAGADWAEAARLANTAAGIAVAKAGTAVVYPTELTRLLHATEVMSTDAKIVTVDEAVERVTLWRARRERVGFTNGCFDLIHPGHISLISQARAACDRLIVGLNSDASVRRLKGETRPVQNETARAIVLASLAHVDLVVVFGEDTPIELIQAIRPDVLVKGADYTVDKVVGADFVRSYGGRVVLAELVPGQSTTRTVARISGADT